ncbi:MAG: DUF554 domain-containing protein [Coriobacteriia bacterium]
MPGLGVLVNIAAVLVGSAVGVVFGHLISERFRSIAFKALGLAIIVIGAQMALKTENVLVLIGSLVVGAVLGESGRIEERLEGFGRWLEAVVKRRPALEVETAAEGPGEGREEMRGDTEGRSQGSGDGSRQGHTLVEGFVSASLLFCVGAMTVVGSLQDGLGDPSVLYVKATLDGVAAIALASTLGVGVAFAVIPIAVLQGGLALGAAWMEPLLTTGVVNEFTAVGGALILAIGLDVAGIKRLPYGDMLPAVFIAGVLGYFFG